MIRPCKTALLFAIAVAFGLTASVRSPATDNPPWTLDLSLSTGATIGVMGEYVYDYVYDGVSTAMRTLSYLDWQLIPLITLGAGIEATAPWGTTLGARAALPLTRVSGTVTNADYEDLAAPEKRTKVSYHTAIVDTYRDLDFWLLQPLASNPDGSVAIRLGYRDRFVRMIAQDGYYEYETTAGEVTGVAITYEQHHRIPYVGLAAESAGKRRMTAGVFFAPCVRVDALDHHHRRLLDFHDTVRGTVWTRLEVGASFELVGQTVEIAGFGELIPETRGDTYAVDYTTDSFAGSTGATITNGAGVSWWAAGLRVSLPHRW